MFYIKTENVDKLCVPFGIIIGPCTVLSNIVKLVRDVASIGFNGLLSINYTPTKAYRTFKDVDLAWEQNVSAKHKPQITYWGTTRVFVHLFADPEYIHTIDVARTYKPKKDVNILGAYQTIYNALSFQDKRYVAFEQAKKDLLQHINFIGIGLIRSVPLVGGIARWIYNARKIS